MMTGVLEEGGISGEMGTEARLKSRPWERKSHGGARQLLQESWQGGEKGGWVEPGWGADVGLRTSV